MGPVRIHSTDASGRLLEVAGVGIRIAAEPTVPANGTIGYMHGCTFSHTDGSGNDALYVNVGTLQSAEFVPVPTLNPVPGAASFDTIKEFTAGGGLWIQSEFVLIGSLSAPLNQPLVRQGPPGSKNSASAILASQVLSGLITSTHSTGGSLDLPLPTGEALDTELEGPTFTQTINIAFDWSLINLSEAAADVVTLIANTGHTIVGGAVVQSAHATTGALYGSSGRFRTRRTGTDTYVTYRIA